MLSILFPYNYRFTIFFKCESGFRSSIKFYLSAKNYISFKNYSGDKSDILLFERSKNAKFIQF
jgi:hypothetical protein